MITDAVEAGRRVRAARAYAGLTRPELAQQCKLGDKALRLLEEGSRSQTTLAELDAIADCCGVPRAFLRYGFQGAKATKRAEQHLAQLRQEVLSLLETLHGAPLEARGTFPAPAESPLPPSEPPASEEPPDGQPTAQPPPPARHRSTRS